MYRVGQRKWEPLVKCNAIASTSNGFLNSWNRLPIDLLTYLYYNYDVFIEISLRFITYSIQGWGSGRRSTSATVKRLQRSQQLLERFPNEISVRRIWFTETTFTIDTKLILKNDYLLSWNKENASSRKDTYTRMWTCSQGNITGSVGVSRMGNTRRQSKQLILLWTFSQTKVAACYSSNLWSL